MRGSDPQLSREDFHHMLCTGRLVALSHGCSSLNPQLWNHTCALEKQRLKRIGSATTVIGSATTVTAGCE